jgi:hypothetical protein
MNWILWIPLVGAALVAYPLLGVLAHVWLGWLEGNRSPALEPGMIVFWPFVYCICLPMTAWKLLKPGLQAVYDLLQDIYQTEEQAP